MAREQKKKQIKRELKEVGLNLDSRRNTTIGDMGEGLMSMSMSLTDQSTLEEQHEREVLLQL
jgi:hypothetical protein